MSGRERFRRHEGLLRALTALVRLAPRALRERLWYSTEGWRGAAGLSLRYAILKSLAKQCGPNVYVGPYVELRAWDRLVVGANVSIHRGCFIDATGGVTIGNDVSIAHASTVLSTEHTWDDASTPIKYNPVRLAPVRIADDVWIGCGCRILAGVTIGSRSVIAAGAVVAQDVEGGVVAAGVPARTVKSIGACSKPPSSPFPKGGQERACPFTSVFPEGGQERACPFTSVFPEGGQKRVRSFIPLWERGKEGV